MNLAEHFQAVAVGFSKPWKKAPVIFQGLEKERAKLSKAWKNAGLVFQSLENRRGANS